MPSRVLIAYQTARHLTRMAGRRAVARPMRRGGACGVRTVTCLYDMMWRGVGTCAAVGGRELRCL